jgi:hypothetical protein
MVIVKHNSRVLMKQGIYPIIKEVFIMNKPIDAKHNGIGGYTIKFENGSIIEHVIARSPHEALEMVKLAPEYYYVSHQKTLKKKVNKIDYDKLALEMENEMYMRGLPGIDY